MLAPVDDATRARMQKWADTHWKHGACSICSSNAWEVGQDLAEMRPYSGGSIVLGTGVYPLLPIICTVCGNTLLVNAIAAGITDRVPPSSEEPPEEPPDSTPPP